MLRRRTSCTHTNRILAVSENGSLRSERAHLEECAACRAALRVHQAFSSLRSTPAAPPSGATVPSVDRIWFRHQVARGRDAENWRRVYRIVGFSEGLAIVFSLTIAVLFFSKLHVGAALQRLQAAPPLPALVLLLASLVGFVVLCRNWSMGRTAL